MKIIKILGNEKMYEIDNGDKVPFADIKQYLEAKKSKPKKTRKKKAK